MHDQHDKPGCFKCETKLYDEMSQKFSRKIKQLCKLCELNLMNDMPANPNCTECK